MLPNPLNLQAWIEEHRHLLKPPVGNKCIYDGDFIVMVVGGPNQRTDYHYEEGPEWFYQLEGEMVLRIQEDGAPRDIPLRAGEIFQAKDGPVQKIVGRYDDELVREGGAWKFASRRYSVLIREAGE